MEGTILTIVREVARRRQRNQREQTILLSYAGCSESGNRMLERTPQMLPVLKEAGVIDSGGQGFLYLFEGMMKALSSEELSAVQLLSTGVAV